MQRYGSIIQYVVLCDLANFTEQRQEKELNDAWSYAVLIAISNHAKLFILDYIPSTICDIYFLKVLSHNFDYVNSIETCVVGGTRQVDSYNTEVNEKDKKEVWERACRLIPSLRVSRRK